MLTVATLFWQPNERSHSFSTMYDETWVEKLYRGFARNLTVPFTFVCYVDRKREFQGHTVQFSIKSGKPSYADCIQPFELGLPMILVGLDTIITGNIDHLAKSCLTRHDIGLPRDPYNKAQACNGVALVPGGMERIALDHEGENDMEWVRRFPHSYLDDEFPGQVNSYKGHVKEHGLGDTRIVYFHGQEKPHQLQHVDWVKKHWR